MCHVPPVTCHLSLTPTATVTDPPPLSTVGWFTVGWSTVSWLGKPKKSFKKTELIILSTKEKRKNGKKPENRKKQNEIEDEKKQE